MEFLRLLEKDRRQIIEQTAAREGLLPVAVEKDWWATLVLRALFNTALCSYLVFKGGTSLSKGWSLIQRFSEDVDIALSREYLGFGENLSKHQRTKLRKAGARFTGEVLPGYLEAQFEELGLPEGMLNLMPEAIEDSDRDPRSVFLFYPSLFEKNAYLQPRIRLEVGTRSLQEPKEQRAICSLVGRQFPDRPFADRPFPVQVAPLGKTFLEKCFLVHEVLVARPGKVGERMSRHLYDLAKLSATHEAQTAIQATEFFYKLREFRRQFTPIKGVDYDALSPDSLNFVPAEPYLDVWREDYRKLCENMVYEPQPLSFEELLKALTALNQKFRQA